MCVPSLRSISMRLVKGWHGNASKSARLEWDQSQFMLIAISICFFQIICLALFSSWMDAQAIPPSPPPQPMKIYQEWFPVITFIETRLK